MAALLRRHPIAVEEMGRVTVSQLFAKPGYVRRQLTLLSIVWVIYGASYVASNFYITYWLTKFKGFSSTGAT